MTLDPTAGPENPSPSPPFQEGDAPAQESPSEVFSEATSQFAELGEYLSSYVKTQVDRAKLTARELAWWVALACLALALATGVLVTGVAFFFYGFAQRFNQLFGGRVWGGFMTTGGGLLLILILALSVERSAQKRRALKKRMRQYEEQLKQQSKAFGHNPL